MGIVIIILLVILTVAGFLAQFTYNKQVKNNYKYPMLTASVVFLLSFAVLAGGILLILFNTLNFSRH